MVFQSYALYPHLTVYKNIVFPLKAQGVPKEQRQQEGGVGGGAPRHRHLLDRKPRELSGGERQRVALARAIVREPRVFLLDEPLSNLDAKLRASAREELEQFQKRIGTTTIYVTHDQVEAMAMGDRVVVMNKGVVRQIGTPADVYDEPADTFVATFLGSPPMNLLEHGDVIVGFRPEHFLPAGRAPSGSGPMHISVRASGSAHERVSRRGAHPVRNVARRALRRAEGRSRAFRSTHAVALPDGSRARPSRLPAGDLKFFDRTVTDARQRDRAGASVSPRRCRRAALARAGDVRCRRSSTSSRSSACRSSWLFSTAFERRQGRQRRLPLRGPARTSQHPRRTRPSARALRNSFVFTICSQVLVLVGSTILALALERRLPRAGASFAF